MICPHGYDEGLHPRAATPEEVDAGCELGESYDSCTDTLRVGEDGLLTLRPEPKPCLPVECPPEVTTLLGVPMDEYDRQAETGQGPPA